MAAVSLVVSLTLAPSSVVFGCTCAGWEFPSAIHDADVAFIGTLIAVGDEQGNSVLSATKVAFEVDRAKDVMPTPVVIDAVLGSGASCGLSMAIGEKWMVIAHGRDGRPETNLCSGSMPLHAMEGPTRDLVLEAMSAEPVPAADDELLGGMNDGSALSSVPLPVWLAGGTALLIALVSAVAFRRPKPD
jgi:hypothetical protein